MDKIFDNMIISRLDGILKSIESQTSLAQRIDDRLTGRRLK